LSFGSLTKVEFFVTPQSKFSRNLPHGLLCPAFRGSFPVVNASSAPAGILTYAVLSHHHPDFCAPPLHFPPKIFQVSGLEQSKSRAYLNVLFLGFPFPSSKFCFSLFSIRSSKLTPPARPIIIFSPTEACSFVGLSLQ